ncbi:hypothetical protein [Luteolibacter luteus]|uniref:Uncharacterized protein n=1 Tax=Luteolibacter luteus TaxID=2728835 RepID=A0A858RGI6_9BACT|nr:hypothetical protein [Luteolibacter luteus]QJE95243.1 hypothetical protein HHL09_05455 [Luteolibacter luteus]
MTQTAPAPDSHRTSGGEITGEEKEAWLRMSQILRAQEDVHAVLAIEWDPDEMRWWYLIETTFATFPRFVVGYTDPENLAPVIFFQSSADWSAKDAWSGLIPGRPIIPF